MAESEDGPAGRGEPTPGPDAPTPAVGPGLLLVPSVEKERRRHFGCAASLRVLRGLRDRTYRNSISRAAAPARVAGYRGAIRDTKAAAMENNRNENGNAQGNDRMPTQSTGELNDRLKRAETEIERLRERLVEFEKTIRENSRDKKSGPHGAVRARRFKSPPAALAPARRS